MVVRLTLLALIFVAMSCGQKSTAERLIGTWARDLSTTGTDVWTFRSDGTCESVASREPDTKGTPFEMTTTAKWRVDAERLLITDETSVIRKYGVVTKQITDPANWTSTIEWLSVDAFSLHDESNKDTVTYKRLNR